MSQREKMGPPPDGGFPRVSGDEPDALLSVYPDQRFSPRERG